MLGIQVSPLTPAAILLLGAIILSFLLPRLPLSRKPFHTFGAPGLVGLVILILLSVRLTPEGGTGEQDLILLSGWNFSTAETVAALTIRADGITIPFLILTLILLFVIMVITATQDSRRAQAGWLVLGAGACLLFVAANGLTLAYAVLIFDILTAVYWFYRRQNRLSVARLFLGVLTAGALILVSLTPTEGLVSGLFLLGLALWLRLGLYPFLETTAYEKEQTELHQGYAIYLGLSLAVGIYLTVRMVAGPLPSSIRWLVALTMVLNGLLAWLNQPVPAQRFILLPRLILTQAMLLLVPLEPLSPTLATAYGMGLILSLLALWITPRLGKPRLAEGAWSWPYIPAIAATFTLIGLPFWLIWPARTQIYHHLFISQSNLLLAFFVMIAEALALSGLVAYWQILWQGEGSNGRRLALGIVVMVPFLLPGLAPLVLFKIMKADNLLYADFNYPLRVYVALGIILMGAISLGRYQTQLLNRFNIPSATLIDLIHLEWLLSWLKQLFDGIAKLILRIIVIIEGKHYIGWVLFAVLVTILVTLLQA